VFNSLASAQILANSQILASTQFLASAQFFEGNPKQIICQELKALRGDHFSQQYNP